MTGSALPAFGQTTQFQVLASFGPSPLNPSSALLQATDGKFYGTAPNGGVNGTGAIFRIDSTGTMETLYSFSLPDQPDSALIQATDGNFYGTTAPNGSGAGAFYKMDSTGTVTVLHSFTGPGGSYPSGGLIQAADGNLYGSTRTGGAYTAYGAVFKIDFSGNVTVVHSFQATGGANPYSGLLQTPDGTFYGTTRNGGAGGMGTIFKIDSSGNLTTLHSFWGADGASPVASLILAADGNFYGTTPGGGENGLGTVFRMDTAGRLVTLHSFKGTDGQAPAAALTQTPEGVIYGVTSAGGRNGDGTVFTIDPDGTLTTIHDFEWTDGNSSVAPLILGRDGKLYGTSAGGGHGSGGVLFTWDVTAGLTILHTFGGGLAGVNPYGGLVQGADGLFYGTTRFGGAAGIGTVFRIDSQGRAVTMHSFLPPEGGEPVSRLTLGPASDFYGTVENYGLTSCLGGCGCVYHIDQAGTFAVTHLFAGSDGEHPYSAPVYASDASIYGTTPGGGAFASGTLYKLDTVGNITVLHSFYFPDGVGTYSDLIQGTDGALYGTAFLGGATNCGSGGNGCGTTFKSTTSGIFTTMFRFPTGTNTEQPWAGLVQARDGYLYGTTMYGQPNNSIFKTTTGGDLSTVYTFHAQDGDLPEGTLLQASDGNLYGTTSNNDNGPGEVFMFNTAPDFIIYHVFHGMDGAYPMGALMQGLNGRLYGTALEGGESGMGTIFSLLPPGMLSVSGVSVGCGPDGGGTATAISGSFPNAGVAVTVGGNAATVTSMTPSAIQILTPAGPTGEPADVFVMDPSNGGATVGLRRAFLYDFTDVGPSSGVHDFVCRIVRNGLAAGCGGGNFCPSAPVLRSQMAIFLLQGEHGLVNLAPAADCTTYPFTDVACPSVFANYILELYNEGVTGGCATNPLRYCPNDPVSRAEMAVFLLTAEHGTGYLPPACTGFFADVPCPGPFTSWIEELYKEGITGGCGSNPLVYCPESLVTRAQMAVFLSTSFNLS